MSNTENNATTEAPETKAADTVAAETSTETAAAEAPEDETAAVDADIAAQTPKDEEEAA